jgi:aminopeptidase
VIDPDAFAALLCDWCLEVRPGQQVAILSSTLAQELVLALHRAVLDRQAWPLLRLSPPELSEQFFAHARDVHLDSHAPLELIELKGIDAWLHVDAPANTRALSAVDAPLIARLARGTAPLQQARLALRWCRTLWPTAALAQQSGMSQHGYRRLVRGMLFLDRPDPVLAWRELSDRQDTLIQRLSQASEIRIQAEGTDLRLGVEGRRWINSDGRRNMPSGEVFTGPLELSASGTVHFSVPSNRGGVEVEDVELQFRDGEVVSARAARGDDYLQAALATDSGARRLGELGIGTNRGLDRPTGSTLLDEKMAGTVHLALGRSYPETGGRNESALHWDLICDLRGEGRLSADGETIELAHMI